MYRERISNEGGGGEGASIVLGKKVCKGRIRKQKEDEDAAERLKVRTRKGGVIRKGNENV